VVESGAIQVHEYLVPAAKVEAERRRFTDAVDKANRQVQKLRRKAEALPATAAEEVGYLLDAHQQMLSGSRLVRGVADRIGHDRVNAEAAVMKEIATIVKTFQEMDDAYLSGRAEDVREVGKRIIRCLTETPYKSFSSLPEDSIVIAEELTPADTALLDPQLVGGFATVLGGAEGHTAIMARSLGLPAVLGAAGLIRGVQSGQPVIVDGSQGLVIVNPRPGRLEAYRRRRSELEREARSLQRLARLPAVTRDGTRVRLEANVELPREIAQAAEAGAEGVGLLRTEFLYMNREDLPGEDEQYAQLRGIVEAMNGHPVTVRTLDVGGDKLAYSLGGHVTQNANPALGLRAIRLSLKERSLLECQLAAVLRAGVHGPVRILLPMISSPGEVAEVRKVLGAVARRLKRRGVKIADPMPPLGVMIEVPGAALAADAFAQLADFFAIGTNDLTMFTLAIDRGEEQVAHLYNPLHPAVLRLIQFAVEAALRARIPVSVCGEMAAEPRFTALLLGLGVRELSMTVNALARVKQRIRNLDVSSAASRAHILMAQSDTGRIAALLDDFNGLA
jgi:phosphotransferase system enzyme I (PtsI)